MISSEGHGATAIITSEQLKALEKLFYIKPAVDGENVDQDMTANLTGTIPLEYVEFELKNAKEYMAKLKFNLLELTSKRVFLDKLMPSGTLTAADLMMKRTGVGAGGSEDTDMMTLSLYDEWTNFQTRWTPGDLKELEKRVEGRKGELKAVKEAVATMKEEISNVTDHVINLRNSLMGDRQAGSRKLKQIAVLEAEIAALKSQLDELAALARQPLSGLVRCGSCEDSGSVVGEMLGIRSVEELKAELAELSMLEEKRAAAIVGHQNNVTELTRLAAHHLDDLAKLETEETRLHHLLSLKAQEKETGNVEASLEQLCVWHRAAIETVADLTRMKFEMIRPDYLLITFTTSAAAPIPVHLTVDPQTGRLLAAQIGSTSATPKHAWKDLCAQAVENNDICVLLHALQQSLY